MEYKNIIRIFITVFLLLFTNSCYLLKENGIEIEIKNNNDSPITDIKFYTSEKLDILEFSKLKPNESFSKFLSMKKNTSDGSYILSFTREDGKIEHLKTGYYTNGGALDRWVRFNVEKDTTLVKYSGIGY
ncbi:hypothetical protein [Algibacter aquimarinus]|uniref:Lipoprotein n=1 Tax=Algibacter aquimarinus TaxID=1136748 RepID=A0ABP9H1U6_9FLAO